jgi:hypothetical protein
MARSREILGRQQKTAVAQESDAGKSHRRVVQQKYCRKAGGTRPQKAACSTAPLRNIR